MTPADFKITVLATLVTALFAWLLIDAGLDVAATHPFVAMRLYMGAGAAIGLNAVLSLWANNQRRAERTKAELMAAGNVYTTTEDLAREILSQRRGGSVPATPETAPIHQESFG